jgi:hypothetical protein
MKKLILIIFGSVFSLNVLAQDLSSNENIESNTVWKYKYCAEMKDGKLTMMNEDKVMTADVTLDNGIIITSDANVVNKDGKKTALKAGECIDTDGKIVEPSKDKMRKDESKKDYK